MRIDITIDCSATAELSTVHLIDADIDFTYRTLQKLVFRNWNFDLHFPILEIFAVAMQAKLVLVTDF